MNQRTVHIWTINVQDALARIYVVCYVPVPTIKMALVLSHRLDLVRKK